MEIKVLGTGCRKCKALEDNVRQAVSELGIMADVDKVTDLLEIMEFDILMTPGLAINGEVKVSGRLPDVEEIKKLIETELSK
ncbi:MAG: thioredoxin family protein [Bacillota bacterium]|nr:thioredoxin family protein [Bacillota bacterium]MDW7684051.1 thioredoxin family protein [Bacillota bacterium]